MVGYCLDCGNKSWNSFKEIVGKIVGYILLGLFAFFCCYLMCAKGGCKVLMDCCDELSTDDSG